MLRRFLDFQLSFFSQKKKLSKLKPLVSALDTFCFEPAHNTKKAPYIRDAIDLKRWMVIVIIALFPAIFMAIWNSGVQKMVYECGNYSLMKEYLSASQSFSGYFDFVLQEGRLLTILKYGSLTFFPLVVISYLVGGLCEAIFACVRGHDIAEGFLVTGMLYPLILPPTIPYWMAALGIAFGVIFAKELFGGTGMNILNPALTARAFLFFTFPGKMSGDVWVGTNPSKIVTSLKEMSTQSVDGITQATPLGIINTAPLEIKKIHIDAIAANTLCDSFAPFENINHHFEKWEAGHDLTLGQLSGDQLRAFMTAPLDQGGLGLLSDHFETAQSLADVTHGLGHLTNGNLFFGNMIGSLGETSTLACLLGAVILIYTGIASWRTMLAFGLSAFIFASLFEWASHLGIEKGAWNVARYAIPAYRHLLFGGLAFGLVFMATDPVSSPSMNGSKWIYGSLIGIVAILIREINPAYPEGVMLAILIGNVFAPLIDYHMVRNYRKKRKIVKNPFTHHFRPIISNERETPHKKLAEEGILEPVNK